MTDIIEPTIEDMQAEILALRKTNEELNTNFKSLQEQSNKTTESLKQARSLNGDLFAKIGANMPDTTKVEIESQVESINEFNQSFINKMLKEYGMTEQELKSFEKQNKTEV